MTGRLVAAAGQVNCELLPQKGCCRRAQASSTAAAATSPLKTAKVRKMAENTAEKCRKPKWKLKSQTSDQLRH